MKVPSNGPVHMAKMAAMPIYGKDPSKSFSGSKRLTSFIGQHFGKKLACCPQQELRTMHLEGLHGPPDAGKV